MGQYPTGEYVIPGIRESFYGRFAVNLGIALPAVSAAEQDRSLPPFVQEYECHIRERLSHLVFKEDVWFDLDHLVDRTASEIVGHMDAVSVPFLERFESYGAVLAEIDTTGSLPGPMLAGHSWSVLWSAPIFATMSGRGCTLIARRNSP